MEHGNDTCKAAEKGNVRAETDGFSEAAGPAARHLDLAGESAGFLGRPGPRRAAVVQAVQDFYRSAKGRTRGRGVPQSVPLPAQPLLLSPCSGNSRPYMTTRPDTGGARATPGAADTPALDGQAWPDREGGAIAGREAVAPPTRPVHRSTGI